MAIEWTMDLTTGVKEIDTQHKELFKRINGLLEACSQGKGKGEVSTVIRFLEDYVITHFSAEENYMTKYNYPDYSGHKAQHLYFTENFLQLKKQFETDGPGIHIVITANRMVVDWLINHIRKVDTALGSFLNTKIQS
jgi:hemerythrin